LFCFISEANVFVLIIFHKSHCLFYVISGAFLIPFFFFMIVCAFPLYYLEVCLGQFSGSSPLLLWRLAPLFRGKRFDHLEIQFIQSKIEVYTTETGYNHSSG